MFLWDVNYQKLSNYDVAKWIENVSGTNKIMFFNFKQIVVQMATQLRGEKRSKMVQLCQYLLNYGANPNLVPSNQIGALDVAVESGDLELIKVRSLCDLFR